MVDLCLPLITAPHSQMSGIKAPTHHSRMTRKPTATLCCKLAPLQNRRAWLPLTKTKRPATSTGQHLPCIANTKAPLTELDPPTKEHAVRLCQCHHELQSRLLLFMGGRPEPLSTRLRSTACSDNGPSSLSDAPQPKPLPAPTAPPSTTFHLPQE